MKYFSVASYTTGVYCVQCRIAPSFIKIQNETQHHGLPAVPSV